MKSTLLFIFSLLVTISGFSQTVYQVDELRMYSWDDSAMPPDWTQNFTEQYTYENGGNKETLIVGLSFPGMQNIYQRIKTYNANYDIVTQVNQAWNPATTSWVNFTQILSTYDGSNNLIEETTQQYVPTARMYTNDTRVIIEYSGSDAIKQTNQSWDGANWVNVEKVDVTYTGGLPTFAEYSEWNSGMMAWDPPYEQDTATYTGSLLMEVITEDLISGDLDRSTYTYAGTLLTELLFENWDGANWVPFDRELSAYDINDNNTELIFEDNGTGPWIGYYKEERDFSEAGALSTDSFDVSNFKAFPNPVGDILNLKFRSPLSNNSYAKLYTLDGRLIRTDYLPDGQQNLQIDMQGLEQGIYLLLLNGNKNKAYKVVKH